MDDTPAPLAFTSPQPDNRAGLGWLVLSALCLGAAAASKYPYLVAGPACAALLLWQRRAWREIAAYAALALIAFFALNVSLWADPVGRLVHSLTFHLAFTQTSQVTRYGFPWWKPLDYLLHPVPWHPGVFYLGWDGWIFGLGMLGLPLLWRRSKLYVVWAVVALLVVLLWPTKWPQYTLLVIPPLCLSLGYGALDIWHWADARFQIGYYLAPFAAPRSTIILAALVSMAAAVILFLQGFIHWQENLGWQRLSTYNSGLISDFVQALAVDGRDTLWVGTQAGLVSFDGKVWTAYTEESHALPHNSVQALAVAPDGGLWVGTEGGLAFFDNTRWQHYRADSASGGPAGNDVRGLAVAPDGVLWVATTTGLSAFDGRTWTPYRAALSGLPSDLVFAVAIAPDGRVWVGTDRGVGVLDPRSRTWQRYDQTSSGLEKDAVRAIAVAPDGRIWLGTLGGGLTVFNGQNWQTQTTSNSALPWNMIVAVAIGPAGDVWVAADLPTKAGGNVARWDGKAWKTFTPQRSGIAAGAATCFAIDSNQRVIIGMRDAGISLYAPR